MVDYGGEPEVTDEGVVVYVFRSLRKTAGPQTESAVTRWAMAKNVDMNGLDNLARFVERMFADAGVQAALEAEEGRAAA